MSPRTSKLSGLGASAMLTALSVSLLVARFVRTDGLGFAFLGWNLLLAWAAHGLASAACAAWDRRHIPATFVLVAAFWAMFPNTFYLVTDLVHLRSTRGPFWHDLALLFACAAAGTALALASLRAIHVRVAHAFGRLWGWGFVGIVAGSTGYAIWLGRILRFNSWDLLLAPARVSRSALAPMLSPGDHLLAWGMTALFGTLLLALYVALHHAAGSDCERPRALEENQKLSL